MKEAAASLRQMRTTHFIFVITVGLYAYASELVYGKNGSQIGAPFLYGMTLMAALEFALMMYFRRTKLEPAAEKLRRDINDAQALKQWRFGNLVSMVLLISIAMYGFALRAVGAAKPVSWCFYLFAFIALLLTRPKLELPAEVPGAVGNQ